MKNTKKTMLCLLLAALLTPLSGSCRRPEPPHRRENPEHANDAPRLRPEEAPNTCSVPTVPSTRNGPIVPNTRSVPTVPCARNVPTVPSARSGPIVPNTRGVPTVPCIRSVPIVPNTRSGPTGPCTRSDPTALNTRSGPTVPSARSVRRAARTSGIGSSARSSFSTIERWREPRRSASRISVQAMA